MDNCNFYVFKMLLEKCNVIEVGSGGGQATEPILKTGCKLTAVEYGKEFFQQRNI